MERPTAGIGVAWFVFGLRRLDLDSFRLASIGNQSIVWGGAFGDECWIISAIPVSRCIGALVIGGSEEQPKRERGKFQSFSQLV